MADAFANRLLTWYEHHGRHDLPWHTTDPYHRWLAEVMLQQTTVTAVIPYYRRFLARFPTIDAIAAADLPAVLELWAGLGYYARARHLHAAARVIVTHHQGRFPSTVEALAALPGIGRSTAGAIAAFAFGAVAPILDANARRVLSRYHRETAPRRLWDYAAAHIPAERAADYTQAIMDLGALVCRRSPQCDQCPLAEDCQFEGDPPVVRAPKPRRQTTMLLAQNTHADVLLVRRPPTGLWGGLWSLPECATPAGADALLTAWGLVIVSRCAWPPVQHAFTHFVLTITPIVVHLAPASPDALCGDMMWYDLADPIPGVPSPVRRLLLQLKDKT
ncbi:MAG: A/G-specific adenine glycosylase [Acidiferrobacter sp.]